MAGSRDSCRVEAGVPGARRAPASGRARRACRVSRAPRACRVILVAFVFLAAIVPARPALAWDADAAERLDEYLDEAYPTSGVPGMAVAVVSASGTNYLRVFGDVKSADDTFIIGSLSKSMTALAVQQIVDEGHIDLDAPAVRYAPGYAVPADVTVRMLLNQTSGFGYYESLDRASVGESYGQFSYANANMTCSAASSSP